MTATQSGMAVGAVLVIVCAVFGFWIALAVAVAMAIGAVIGRIVDGRLDISRVVAAFRGGRVSS